MTGARLRPVAESDLVERTRHYLAEAGEAVADRFFNAGIAALEAAERMPGAGSPRLGDLCDIPGLRMRRIDGFPYGWVYFDRIDHIDVVRLLSDAQDIPAIVGQLHDD